MQINLICLNSESRHVIVTKKKTLLFYSEMSDKTQKNERMDIELGILNFTSSQQAFAKHQWQQFGKENIQKWNGGLLVSLQLGVMTKYQQIKSWSTASTRLFDTQTNTSDW